jgi:hypothetical protein
MKRRHDASVRTTRPILKWVFTKNTDSITCQLDLRPDMTYEVRVVPNWSNGSVVERIGRPTEALLRHAELAACLRDNGWMMDGYYDGGRRAAAA